MQFSTSACTRRKFSRVERHLWQVNATLKAHNTNEANSLQPKNPTIPTGHNPQNLQFSTQPIPPAVQGTIPQQRQKPLHILRLTQLWRLWAWQSDGRFLSVSAFLYEWLVSVCNQTWCYGKCEILNDPFEPNLAYVSSAINADDDAFPFWESPPGRRESEM